MTRVPLRIRPELHSLRKELAEAEQRSATQLALFTEALARLRTQIPEMVEEVIASRFLEVEERFYTQVREIQQRSMDSFLQSANARVGTRMASLESTLAEQSAAMAEMRDNYVKSDRNIDRLLQGVDRLTLELMRLSTLAGAPIVTRRVTQLSPSSASGSSCFCPTRSRSVDIGNTRSTRTTPSGLHRTTRRRAPCEPSRVCGK